MHKIKFHNVTFPFIKYFVIWAFSLVLFSEIIGFFNSFEKIFFYFFWFFTFFTLFFLLIVHTKEKINSDSSSFKKSFTNILIAIFLFILFFQGLVYPPNNFDSMTYHLPRIFYWIQQESLDFFSTNNFRQLVFGPFSGLIYSALFFLTSSDLLFNLVHWICLIVILYTSKGILEELNPLINSVSTFFIFIITLPMLILQSTTTQNDLLVSTLLLLTLFFAIKIEKSNGNENYFYFSSSLGLAILTKSTAYIFGFTIYILAFIYSFKKKKLHIFLTSNMLIILLNFGSYYRNIDLTGNPLGLADNITGTSVINETYGLKPFISNFLRNSSSQLILPSKSINDANEKVVKNIHTYLDIDINDPKTTFSDTKFNDIWFTISEDMSGNPIHYLIILVCISIFIFKKKYSYYNKYILLNVISLIIFLAFIKWQPWINRLVLPFFILIAPFICLIIEKFDSRIKKILFIFLILYSLPFLLMNFNKPILKFSHESKVAELSQLNKVSFELFDPAYIIKNREKYLSADEEFFIRFKNLFRSIQVNNCKIIGVEFGDNSPEYWLWYLLNSENKIFTYELYHYNVKNISNKYANQIEYDCIFDSQFNLIMK